MHASSRTSPTISTWDSGKYAKIFGAWVTALKQEYTARRKSAPRSSGNGSSSSQRDRNWLTPTPVARDYKSGADWSGRQRDRKPRRWSDMMLPDAVKAMWPTPSACSYGSNRDGAAGRTGPARPPLQALASMSGGDKCPRVLNLAFVEILQGLPLGWTDCGRSATASFRRWLALHGFPCGGK